MIMGPGLNAVDHEGPQKDGDDRVDRNAQRKERNEGSSGGGIVGRLRTGNTLNDAGPKFFRVFGELLLNGIGTEGGDDRRRTWKDSDEEAEDRSPDDRPERVFPVLEIGQKVFYLRRNDLAFHDLLLDIGNDLSHAKEAHDGGNQTHSIAEFENTKGQTLGAGDTVHPDGADQQPEDKHHQGLQDRTRGQIDQDNDPKKHQAEILGGSEGQGKFGQRRGNQHETDDRYRSGDERPKGGNAQRRTGPALSGHLIPVQAGDHRGRFPRDVDQDGGRRSSIHGAVIDPGKHDDGRHRGDMERVWKEQGNGGRRAETRKDADKRPHEARQENRRED